MASPEQRAQAWTTLEVVLHPPKVSTYPSALFSENYPHGTKLLLKVAQNYSTKSLWLFIDGN